MVYVVLPQADRHRKMTFHDLLFSNDSNFVVLNLTDNTITYEFDDDYVSENIAKKMNIKIGTVIQDLEAFIQKYKELYDADRTSLYHTFHIPKKSGGLRRIDAPQPALMNALRDLKRIFDSCGSLHHTTAFAYVSGRSTIDAVKRHQRNESNWFAKLDLHNFFGSTTEQFVLKMFSMIYPFSEIMKNPIGREVLPKALSLAFLNGGLPQGTPVSPLVTNIMMIPFDFNFNKWCRQNHMIYTRYADDFIVSSRCHFRVAEVESAIRLFLHRYEAPFELNESKTRYGSRAGSNWNLGVMLNKDNNITIGNRNKRRFQAMLHSYVLDRRNGNPWSLNDVQVLEGLRSYYLMVEREPIKRIVDHMSRKLDADIVSMIKEDLRNATE